MPQPRSFVRPVLVLLFGLVLGWLVLAVTLDRVFARGAPLTALRWNPGGAEANARAADLALVAGGGTITPDIARRATRSLLRQPVNPAAARLLGLAVAGRDPRRAEGLVRYAEAMSRRDLATQLWLIETRVARGDVRGALRHYDRALRTSSQGRQLLFPILAAAASERAVWDPLADLLVRRPQWWRPFVVDLVPASTSPDALYAIARRMGLDRAEGGDPALLQAIEKRLVELGAYARAADLYGRANRAPVNAGALLRNGGFDQPGGWDPFQWNLIDDPDLAAVRQPSPVAGGGQALFLSATNGRGGDVAVQLVLLPPGRYRWGATVGGVAGDPLAFPRLVVRCAADGRVLADARFPAAPEGGRAWQGDFAVPAGCTAQRVVLSAASSLDPSDAAPWIDDLVLRREGAR